MVDDKESGTETDLTIKSAFAKPSKIPAKISAIERGCDVVSLQQCVDRFENLSLTLKRMRAGTEDFSSDSHEPFRHSWMLDFQLDLASYAIRNSLFEIAEAHMFCIESTIHVIWRLEFEEQE